MYLRNTIDWAKARLGLEAVAEETARLAAEFMAERARLYCPVRTGFLRASIQIIKSSASNRYHVVATAPYAGFVEWGHMARGTWVAPNPFLRRALAETAAAFPGIARGVAVRRPGAGNTLQFTGASFGAAA